MAINNKTIETNKQIQFFVIVVERDGVKKYIDKNWLSYHHVNCTVIISKAKRFNSEEAAIEFFKERNFTNMNLKLVAIIPLMIDYNVDLKLSIYN